MAKLTYIISREEAEVASVSTPGDSTASDSLVVDATNATNDYNQLSLISADIKRSKKEDEEALLQEEQGLTPEKNIEVSREELKWFYHRIGIDTVDVSTLSRESIVKSKGFLGNTLRKFTTDIVEGAKGQWAALNAKVDMFRMAIGNLEDFNLNKLEELRSDLEDDYYVPKEYLTDHDKEKLKNKFGILATFEYSVGGDCRSFIEYLEMFLEIFDPANGYMKAMDSWVNAVGKMDYDKQFDMGKEQLSINLMDRIKDADFEIDPKSEEYRMAIVTNFFTKKANVTSVYEKDYNPTNDKADGVGTVKAFDVSDDTFDNSQHLRMKLITKDGALELVNWVINNKRKIQHVAESAKRYESERNGRYRLNIMKAITKWTEVNLDAARVIAAMDKCMAINIGHVTQLDKIVTDYIHTFVRKKTDRDVERD